MQALSTRLRSVRSDLTQPTPWFGCFVAVQRHGERRFLSQDVRALRRVHESSAGQMGGLVFLSARCSPHTYTPPSALRHTCAQS